MNANQVRAVVAALIAAATGIATALGFDIHELAGLVTTLVETVIAIAGVVIVMTGKGAGDGRRDADGGGAPGGGSVPDR